MKRPLFPRAGFLQFAIRFGDISANLDTVHQLISDLQPEPGTLLVLPELWASGFDYANAVDHARQTPMVLERISGYARKNNIFMAGSLLELSQDLPLPSNTLFVTGPEGIVGKFQKQHLFALWQEDSHFQPGNFSSPIMPDHGMVGGQVCYDLRFPEVTRDLVFRGAVIIVVSAQWPAIRLDHWRTLLQARAIENQVFVVAGNSCGVTGDKVMAGHSMVIAPDGEILIEAADEKMALTAVLENERLDRARGRFCTAGERPRPARDGKKIQTLEHLIPELAVIRDQRGKIAFTNGCFDILHAGHVAYLEKARGTADCLVVGLNSDASVRSIKGDGRPINNEFDRARVLASLGCVDFIVPFAEDTPIKLIGAIMPDVLVKGSDWPEKQIVGAREVKAAGGSVIRIDFEHAVSTSQVISRVQKKLMEKKDRGF